MPMIPLALRAVLLVLLALVPAAMVQGVLEREARLQRSQQVAEQAMRLARLVAAQQDRTFEGARHLLAAMAAHDAIRAARPSAECNAFLGRLVAQYPRYISATVFDTAGNAVCTAQASLSGTNVAHRAYFQRVMAGSGFTVGEYAVGMRTQAASLHLAAPLQAADGGVIGVLVVALSIDWLGRDLRSLDLPGGTAATLADRNGIILARTLAPERFVGQALPPFALEFLHAPNAGIIDAPAFDGVRRIAAYIPISQAPQGLLVVLGLDADGLIQADLLRDRWVASLIVGSLLLSLFVAIGAFHLGVERPMRRVLTAAQAWSRQQWQVRIGHIGGGREFTRLGAALDRMAEDVRLAEAARAVAALRIQALNDVSPQVVFTADKFGRLDWLNGYWENLTGRSMARSVGMGWLFAVHRTDRSRALAAWGAALADAATGGPGEFSVELRLRRADGAWRWFLVRGAPIREADGNLLSWAGVGLDFHDLREARRQAAEQAGRLEATYRNAPVGLCLFDAELRYLAINTLLAESNGAPAEAHLGRTLREMMPLAADATEPLARAVLETGEAIENVEVAHGPGRVWLFAFHPVRRDDGRVIGVSASALEITARKRAEQAQLLLSREVDHRAKNVLAVVRSLVRISAAEVGDDVDSLVEVLEGRIAAMARVHTVLSREGWLGADIAEIVTQEVDVYGAQVVALGAMLRLVPEAAQPLTLVLHELATNAAKYGALSRAEGRLLIEWARDGEDAVIQWTEQGGPLLEGPPARGGFGTELIDANASAPLDGGITREWRREGLHCTLRIGARALRPGGA